MEKSSPMFSQRLARRRGDHGFDAPYVPAIFLLTGNARSATQKNAEQEGVAGRIDLHTADMRQLPFADNSFDLVLSSLAIHNIPQREDRYKALDEAVRVLQPGGRLIIADIHETHRYAEHLRELGMTNVTHQMLD